MHTKRYVITIAMSPSKRYRFLLRKTIRKTICKRWWQAISKRCHYDRLFFTGLMSNKLIFIVIVIVIVIISIRLCSSWNEMTQTVTMTLQSNSHGVRWSCVIRGWGRGEGEGGGGEWISYLSCATCVSGLALQHALELRLNTILLWYNCGVQYLCCFEDISV